MRNNDINMLKPSATYLLIQTNPNTNPVTPGDNLDSGLTGSLHGSEFSGFSVLDSVGALTNNISSPGDVGYGYLNFNDTGGSTNQFTPNSQVVPGAFTASYIGRSGNTLGWQASDWVASDKENGTVPYFTLGPANSTSPVTLANYPLNTLGSANFLSNPPAVVTTTSTPLVYSPTTIVTADPNITVSAPDSGFLVGASVAITGYISGQDTLSFTPVGNITGNFDVGTGILSLSGSDSVANYQTALRSVTYSNNNLGAHNRVLTFVANDGNPNAGSIRLVKINNQPPVIDLNAPSVNYATTWSNTAPSTSPIRRRFRSLIRTIPI